MASVKVLTLKQPWAWAVFHAGKDIENRSWLTDSPEVLFIHSGKSFDTAGVDFLKSLGINPPNISSEDMRFGAIIGCVKLCSISKNSRSKWAIANQYHWQIENPELFAQPIPARGRLGLWEFDLSDRVVSELSPEKRHRIELAQLSPDELADHYGGYDDPRMDV